MAIRERDRTGSGRAALGLLLGLGACAGGGASADEAPLVQPTGDLEGPGCIVERIPLTVRDGVYAYIEPENLFEVPSGWVVVGSPSFTWAPGTPGDSLPLTYHRHLAARFGLDGRATLIERPLQDSVGYVRALPLDGERWGVLFDIERGGRRARSVALWYAEHDGTAWSLLEPVPMPEEGELRMNESSELVRAGDELVWIVPVLPTNGTSQVLEYTRRDGQWERRVIGDDWVEASTMAYEEGAGLWMARSGPDARRTELTLKLYRRDGEWQLVRNLYVSTSGTHAYGLGIMLLPDGAAVSWHLAGGADDGVYAVVGIGPDRDGTLVDLERRVFQVIPVPSEVGDPRWLVTHVNEAARRMELRLLAPGSIFGAERLAVATSPYPGFIAARARTAEETVVAGAEMSSDPAHPFVRSLILRLSTSCT